MGRFLFSLSARLSCFPAYLKKSVINKLLEDEKQEDEWCAILISKSAFFFLFFWLKYSEITATIQ